MGKKRPERWPIPKDHGPGCEWPPDNQRHYAGYKSTFACSTCGYTTRQFYVGSHCPSHPEVELLNLGAKFRMPKRHTRVFRRLLSKWK